MAYPTYYDNMCRFIDLRDALTAVAKAAKKAKAGIWKKDKTGGLTVNGEQQLVDRDVVMPKLFRRLSKYLRENGGDVGGFKKWLKDRDEHILVLSNGLMGSFDEVISENGKQIGLTKETWDVIFKP